MSFLNAKAEAQNRIARLPIPQGDEPLDGLTITLMNFENDTVAAGLVGGNSSKFQFMCNKAAAKLLKARGAEVQSLIVRLNSVVHWSSESETKPLSVFDRLLFAAEVLNACIQNNRELPRRGDELHQQLQQTIKDAQTMLDNGKVRRE